MSPTFNEVSQRDQTSRLVERLHRIRSSLEWSREAIPPAVATEVDSAIRRCDERLALGVDHAVVALAGGTGSGKSSLFNALIGQDFAIPGVARPTTSQISAATWGSPATALLDWLGVQPDRRLALDTREDWDLLVLLDLPDHDSVNAENRAVVDQVVPMADLLVWVVDPQKYADHALHSAYLSVASGHQRPSMVVLNHVDRLHPDDAGAVVDDLRRLLAEDGLDQVQVIPASATTGQGVDDLRAALHQVTTERTVAWRAVRADLIAAGRALEGALSREAEPRLPEVDDFVRSVARCVGVDARADAAADYAAGRSRSLATVGEITVATLDKVRLAWVDEATAGLPVQWHTVVNQAVPSVEVLARDLSQALSLVAWPQRVPRVRWLARLLVSARELSARRDTLARGREAVRQVVVPLVVEPTQMIHESYRALDELTELEY